MFWKRSNRNICVFMHDYFSWHIDCSVFSAEGCRVVKLVSKFVEYTAYDIKSKNCTKYFICVANILFVGQNRLNSSIFVLLGNLHTLGVRCKDITTWYAQTETVLFKLKPFVLTHAWAVWHYDSDKLITIVLFSHSLKILLLINLVFWPCIS